jgi:hypothetical protein
MTSRSASTEARTASPSGIWSKPVAAVRANLVPGLLLQAFAIAVILAYYRHEPTHRLLDAIAGFKARTGFVFSILATAFFGGLVPYLFLRLDARSRAATPLSHGVFLTLFWAYKGLEVDAFYRFQGRLFGAAIDLPTVAGKVAVDMLVYNPFWSTPVTLLVFYWKEHGFSFAAARKLDKAAFLRDNLPAALVTVWSIWLPAATVIYCLPGPLQVPLFDIVLCFFSLVLATLTRRASR